MKALGAWAAAIFHNILVASSALDSGVCKGSCNDCSRSLPCGSALRTASSSFPQDWPRLIKSAARQMRIPRLGSHCTIMCTPTLVYLPSVRRPLE